MEFPAMKRLLLALLLVLAGAVTAIAILRSGPTPTEEERKQMDILTGQLFEIDGRTNEIISARTLAAFDRQHDVIPCLRTVADLLATNNWPKNRPLRVTDLGDEFLVVWPLPPEIESQPIRWSADFVYATTIKKRK